MREYAEAYLNTLNVEKCWDTWCFSVPKLQFTNKIGHTSFYTEIQLTYHAFGWIHTKGQRHRKLESIKKENDIDARIAMLVEEVGSHNNQRFRLTNKIKVKLSALLFSRRQSLWYEGLTIDSPWSNYQDYVVFENCAITWISHSFNENKLEFNFKNLIRQEKLSSHLLNSFNR